MAEDIVTEFIDDVEHAVEDIAGFKPGGMIDRHRQERARREAAAKEAENSAEKVEEASSFAVKVTQLSPETTAVNTVTVPAGGVAQVLPLNKYRYRATIIASATVTLAPNNSMALGGQGYPLPANTPMVILSRAQLFAGAAGAATVSVFAEIYAPETK